MSHRRPSSHGAMGICGSVRRAADSFRVLRARARLASKQSICRNFRCRRRDSNPRHADYDSATGARRGSAVLGNPLQTCRFPLRCPARPNAAELLNPTHLTPKEERAGVSLPSSMRQRASCRRVRDHAVGAGERAGRDPYFVALKAQDAHHGSTGATTREPCVQEGGMALTTFSSQAADSTSKSRGRRTRPAVSGDVAVAGHRRHLARRTRRRAVHPDIVSSSAGSLAAIQSAIVVAFFAWLATWVVARHGFAHPQRRRGLTSSCEPSVRPLALAGAARYRCTSGHARYRFRAW